VEYTYFVSIHPQVTIGHVHLTVSDLERSLRFYRDLLGFEVTSRYGDSAVFLSAGGYHHHIGLNTWAGKGAPPPPEGRTGLYHFAILYPSRKELARALQRLVTATYHIDGAADHGVSEAVYLKDPDGIGIEIYADRPKKEWKVKNDGEVEMVTKSLDLQVLLVAASDPL
jgi:catechol 2,3-dioxygenase